MGCITSKTIPPDEPPPWAAVSRITAYFKLSMIINLSMLHLQDVEDTQSQHLGDSIHANDAHNDARSPTRGSWQSGFEGPNPPHLLRKKTPGSKTRGEVR